MAQLGKRKRGDKSKIFNDPVHGHIWIPSYALEIVDTPQFQRLRDLAQVGSTPYVFAGANHTRFEHSIGVCHLSNTLVNRFKTTQQELGLTTREVKLVTVAGLCHDLGHGPFSHAFEKLAQKFSPSWTHEDMSVKMLRHLIDANGLDWEEDDIAYVTDLIAGVNSDEKQLDKMFLFDIVANHRNSIDVDKLDYVARDCYHVGMKSSYDYQRLMNMSRVINNEICYHSKEVYNIYELFHTRYSLFKQVYTHRVGRAVDFMVQDAIELGASLISLQDSLESAEEFCHLTDSVVRQIEFSKDNNKGVREARELIRRLHSRDLYKMVGEVLVPPSHTKTVKSVGPQDFLSGIPSSVKIDESDIVVDKIKLNYAMQERNPVDSVRFFSSWESNESFSIPRNQVSFLIPEEFAEHYVRVYCKKKEHEEAVQEAFQKYLKRNGLNNQSNPTFTPPPKTPVKRHLFRWPSTDKEESIGGGSED